MMQLVDHINLRVVVESILRSTASLRALGDRYDHTSIMHTHFVCTPLNNYRKTPRRSCGADLMTAFNRRCVAIGRTRLLRNGARPTHDV